MQTRKSSNTRHVQSSQTGNPYARYMQADPRRAAVLIGLLCLILPPVGIALAWRSRRMTIPLRAGLSALGFVAMTFLFILLMKPDKLVSDIRPTPVVPNQAGYGTKATEAPTPEPTLVPTEVPVQQDPGVVADPGVAQPDDSTALTDESIVYAVTNNASSYHLMPVCEMQENNRSLTLREALDEGLEPCPKCVNVAG